jgi:hypothetical protein
MDDIILNQRIEARWNVEPSLQRCENPEIPAIPPDVFKSCLSSHIDRYYEQKAERLSTLGRCATETDAEVTASRNGSHAVWIVLLAAIAAIVVMLILVYLRKNGANELRRLFSGVKKKDKRSRNRTKRKGFHLDVW